MNRLLKNLGFSTWITLALLIWLAVVVSVQANGPRRAGRAGGAENTAAIPNNPQGPPPQPAPAQQPVPATQAGYIGEKECIGCHDAQAPSYLHSKHARVADPRTPGAKLGCESCHGPGKAHADDTEAKGRIKVFKTMSADEVNGTCTSCHTRGQHALWDGSQHERRDLSCVSCHSVHAAKSEQKQLKTATQSELCAPCHREKTAKVDRSGHMPVREGKMECSSCHNVHGSTNVKLLAKGQSVAELCTTCHAEKRGPYLWEHPPGRDGCVTCHDPHGSSNERMLVAKPPILCQRCHIHTRHPSTIYDAALVGAGSSPSVRVYARSCVTCHSAIHGSNHPSGQFFIR
jgi:DmsE family decaheme c-type cytochrome